FFSLIPSIFPQRQWKNSPVSRSAGRYEIEETLGLVRQTGAFLFSRFGYNKYLNNSGASAVALIVQKYGGTSVANADLIANVANRVIQAWRDGHKMVVVLSAMAGETDRLIGLGKELAEDPDPRELDVLLATGEQ